MVWCSQLYNKTTGENLAEGIGVGFSTLEKQYIPDQVFDTLKREILEQRITAGEKLPSEGVLSKQFGVSKVSIKAALQRLVTLGLIETRVGQGSFVLEFNPQQCIEQLHDFLLGDSEISSIIEFRMYIEMAATRLAIKKATEENFKKMEEYLAEMNKAREKSDMDLYGQMDYMFHLEIWKATQNEVFEMAYKLIGSMLLKHITTLNKEHFKNDKQFLSMKQDIHNKLFEAIKNKDIALCRAAYLKMFSVYERISPIQYQDC